MGSVVLLGGQISRIEIVNVDSVKNKNPCTDDIGAFFGE